MSKQAMQQALEALQDAEEVLHFQKESKRLSTISPAIETLKVAIDATPEPDQDREPIYMFRRLGTDYFITCSKKRFDELSEKDLMFQTKVAYNLPRKPFVRLSEEEIAKCLANTSFNHEFARAIEDALEEKNKRTMTGGGGIGMTDKACELLEMAIEEWDSDRDLYEFHKVMEEIRAYLAEPEQDEVVILTASQIASAYTEQHLSKWTAFCAGVRFAEKHHGIGGGE